jgi:hypothetical protein
MSTYEVIQHPQWQNLGVIFPPGWYYFDKYRRPIGPYRIPADAIMHIRLAGCGNDTVFAIRRRRSTDKKPHRYVFRLEEWIK